jgi:hypothetical protein
MNKLIYSIVLVVTSLLVVYLAMNFEGGNGYNIATMIVSALLIIYSLMKLIE